ncbi:MAG: OmpA family protein [Flavobacteriaceae bacterium]|nr:OmpA family protein [Flavobacteriaceae bacterium]
MNEFEFDNVYQNGETGTNSFTMGVPAIYSVGLGYSKGIIDLALDYRYVDYANTDGFEKTGWTQYGAVEGFGWESISIVSAGLQLKAIKKVPLRFGYTYSTNPINEELVFYSTPATAIIAHAFQFGFSILFSDAFSLDAVYHYGMSDGETEGKMLNPMMASPSNPLGAMENTRVAYDMNTQLFMLGLDFKFGGKDTDGDGIKDKNDDCPEIAGLEQFNGCPDSDGDGIKDSEDACPDVAGLAKFNGCPDTDGDGFPDKEDLCPTVAGLEQFNGCPDTDGDGVMDSMDKCPNEAGTIDNEGCPVLDTDGDGIVDAMDNCPNIAGVASNNGCPIVTEEVQKQITDLARAIFFNVNKFTFTDETQVRLVKISKILGEYQTINFTVEGHTDDTGSAAYNKKLSQKRADAVRSYLVENGFPADKITAIGYGEEKPICPTKTKKCRQANRRVDIFSENATR